MTNEIISAIANVALALSFIVALVFGIAQVRAAARDRRERLTLETLRNFQTREFAELLYFITSRDMPASREALQALPANEQIMFIQFAQQMESLGILVAERLIDIDLVDKTLGSFVTTAWKKYKTMFLDGREKLPDPFLGEYFQWLAERIDERMRENPRKPFHETYASTGRGAKRRPPVSDKTKAKILNLLAADKGVREAARLAQVSHAYVVKVRKMNGNKRGIKNRPRKPVSARKVSGPVAKVQ